MQELTTRLTKQEEKIGKKKKSTSSYNYDSGAILKDQPKLKFQRKKMQELFQHQWSFFGFYFKHVLKIFGISIKKKNNMKVFFHHYLYHQYHLKQLHNGKLKSLQM